MIQYIRRSGGKVIEKGTARSWDAMALLRERHPGEYFEDDGSTELTPVQPAVRPLPIPTNYPSVEELTDAFLKHLDGDVSAFAAIRARLKK